MQGALWCIKRDWYDGLKVFLEEFEHPPSSHMVLPFLLYKSVDESSKNTMLFMLCIDGKGVDIDQIRTAGGATLLQFAARAGRLEVVRRLAGSWSRLEHSRRRGSAQCPLHGRL